MNRIHVTTMVGCLVARALAGAGPAEAQAPTTPSDASANATRIQSASVVGDLRLETFTSKVFANTRHLRVLLPEGYDAPENRTRRYPILYLADGQNLFDPATSVFGPSEWKVDETVHRLVAENRIPPMIVVGVDDAGRIARSHEYLPWADTSNARQDPNYDPSPQGRRYPNFLIDEVMPFINGRYRTLHDAAHTGLGGSSYGGLISTYVFSVRPGVFGRALVESPTMSVFEGQMLRDLKRVREFPQRVYVAVGTNEDGARECNPNAPVAVPAQDVMVRGVQMMTSTLRAAGLDSTRLRVVIEPCATHTHAAWAARLPAALAFLFAE